MVKDLFVCGLLHSMNHVDPAHGWCRMGWDWAVTIMRYGELWRRHRKIIHQKFHPTAVEEYYPVQIKHARYTFPLISQQMYLTGNSLLLQRLHETPDDFVDHVRHNSGAIIMEACCSPFYSLFFLVNLQINSQIVYGIKVLPKEDPYIATAENAIAGVTVAGNPGAFLVDVLPICTSAYSYNPPFLPSSFSSPFWLLWQSRM